MVGSQLIRHFQQDRQRHAIKVRIPIAHSIICEEGSCSIFCFARVRLRSFESNEVFSAFDQRLMLALALVARFC